MAGLCRADKYPDLSIYHSVYHSPGRLFYGCRAADRQRVEDWGLLSCVYARGPGSCFAGFLLRKGKAHPVDLADPSAADLALADLAGVVQGGPAGAERGVAALGRAEANGKRNSGLTDGGSGQAAGGSALTTRGSAPAAAEFGWGIPHFVLISPLDFNFNYST